MSDICFDRVPTKLKPSPPGWVEELLGIPDRLPLNPPMAGSRPLEWNRGAFAMFATSVNGVASLSAASFIESVREAYAALARTISARQRHPLRFWNFIPHIHDALDGIGDRYMAFNMGRFAAFAQWFGTPDVFEHPVPTASAVGVEGDAFWVYVLAGDAPGVPVENPRQRPSYLYSRRYGPRPPCFSRATKCDSTLFIGGTASIIDERSRHIAQIEAQTVETLRNMAEVIKVAAAEALPESLAALRDLRLYLTRPDYSPTVLKIVSEHALNVRRVEVVTAKLCRPELLVEIEGVAALNPRPWQQPFALCAPMAEDKIEHR
jgi:enamine deaminase RidA (YjgF/YER057c/UK114 family)